MHSFRSRTWISAAAWSDHHGYERKFRSISIAVVIADREKALEDRLGKNMAQTKKKVVQIRILADHVSAPSFLIGDGVIAFEHRVRIFLTRLLRRAIRHADKLEQRHR